MQSFQKEGSSSIKNALIENIKLFIVESKKYIIILFLSILISTILAVSAPYLFSLIIDQMTSYSQIDKISLGLILYAILIGLSLIFKDTVTYIAVIIAEILTYITSTNFFKKILVKEPQFFIKHNPTEIQAMQNQGVFALQKVIQLSLILFIPGLLQIIFSCFILGIKLDLRVVLIVIIYGLFFIGFSYYSSKRIEQDLERATSERQQNTQLVGNAISMIDTLRYFNAGKWMDQRFEQGAHQILKSLTFYSLKRIFYAAIFGLALSFQFIITFYLFIPEVKAGRMSVGELVLFNTLLLQLNTPFESIGRCIFEFTQSYIEFKPFAKMWNEPEFIENQGYLETNPSHKSSRVLQFQEVSFHYDNGRGIEKINFRAERGKITFLTGESGKGKSTIFKLILKQLEPDQGQILIDGINLKDIHRKNWFSQVGVIPQEVMLINDSIKNNICLGRPYNQQRIYRAAEKAQILDRINAMPEGFDTIVGERGMILSGGEKQRISIARALYMEPEFLFLDEASSNLDQGVEYEIMNHIRTLKTEVTIIAITHNLNLIQAEDVIVKL